MPRIACLRQPPPRGEERAKECPPAVSVIVPFLDEEKYLPRCLDSLQRQDCPRGDYELIFVDNGSRDESAAIVRGSPGVILVREPGPNVYAARNKALRIARGRVIAFTDADCEVGRGWVKEIQSALASGRTVLVQGPRRFPSGVSGSLELFARYENAKAEALCDRGPRELIFGSANNLAVRAEAFGRVGFFDERDTAADIDFVQRCLRCDPAARAAYRPGMEVVHLEVTRLAVWFQKLAAYGRLIARTDGYRPLPLRIKLATFALVSRQAGLGSFARMRFLAWLTVGNAFFAWGSLRGRLAGPLSPGGPAQPT
jgi:glycosyltransferase involved in cell wall biosynthesis